MATFSKAYSVSAGIFGKLRSCRASSHIPITEIYGWSDCLCSYLNDSIIAKMLFGHKSSTSRNKSKSDYTCHNKTDAKYPDWRGRVTQDRHA